MVIAISSFPFSHRCAAIKHICVARVRLQEICAVQESCDSAEDSP